MRSCFTIIIILKKLKGTFQIKWWVRSHNGTSGWSKLGKQRQGTILSPYSFLPTITSLLPTRKSLTVRLTAATTASVARGTNVDACWHMSRHPQNLQMHLQLDCFQCSSAASQNSGKGAQAPITQCCIPTPPPAVTNPTQLHLPWLGGESLEHPQMLG